MGRTRVIDLFCGAGGASLGLAEAGFEVCGAVDVDDDALDVYEQNLCEKDLSNKGIEGCVSFNKPMQADLKTTSFEEICEWFKIDPDTIDAICGCPPCQNFSTLRDTDPWPEYQPKDALLRAFVDRVREGNPRYVFFENVPGILTAGEGEKAPTTYIDWFKSAMKTMGEEGYGINLRVVNAADYGVPQRRRRTVGICIYGVDDDEIEFPDKTHARNSEQNSDLNEWVTVRSTILGETPNLKTDLDLGEKQVDVEGYDDDQAHRARRHRQSTIEMIEAIRRHGEGWPDLEGTSDEDLIKKCHEDTGTGAATAAYGIMRPDEPAPTLTTRCTNVSSGRFTHPVENRAITFREAALLMTLPEWFELPKMNSHAERVVGNAVPPTLIEKLFGDYSEIELPVVR